MTKRKKRAMSSEKARSVRRKGHEDAKLFAVSIGLDNDYRNDPKAKKDVIDQNGDAHSVKSGDGYWQIFLYSLSRFENDYSFKAMNGIGQIIIKCIKGIPENKAKYQKNKEGYKTHISQCMVELKEKLDKKYILEAFLEKSIFNGNEVTYLTIKHNNMFHIFLNKDITNILADNFEITNYGGKIPSQKVLFRLKNKNCGEIEMRNGEDNHHRELKFRLHKLPIVKLLLEKIKDKKIY